MPIVRHTVKKSDGTDGELNSVVISLLTGDTVPVAFRKSDLAGIDTDLDITPNGSMWSVNLTSNLNISPDNSVYKVTETLSDYRFPAIWYFSVPDGPGPYELAQILTTAPNGLPPAIVINQGGGGGSSSVTETFVNNKISDHVEDDEPHPAYDDMQSLTLLFENGLV